MSDYGDIETRWLTLAQGLSRWSSTNSGRGKYNVLSKGQSSEYLILHAGQHDHPEAYIGGKKLHTFRTVFEIWRRVRPTMTDWTTDVTDIAEELREQLQKYRTLNSLSGVQKSRIVQTQEPIQVDWDGDREPDWIRIRVIGECDFEETITFSD